MNYENTPYEQREYMYIPKTLADDIKAAEGDDAVSLVVDKYIKERGIKIDDEIANLEERKLQFKSIATSYRNELNKITQEEIKKLDEIWDKYPSISKDIREKSEKLSLHMRPIYTELKKIDELTKSVSKWQVQDLVQTLELLEKITPERLETLAKFTDFLSKDNS